MKKRNNKLIVALLISLFLLSINIPVDAHAALLDVDYNLCESNPSSD